QLTLSATNPPTLTQTNVLTNTVVITDTTGSITYTPGADYALLMLTNGLVQVSRLDGSSIPDGATISASFESLCLPIDYGINLAVSSRVDIELGGAIKA